MKLLGFIFFILILAGMIFGIFFIYISIFSVPIYKQSSFVSNLSIGLPQESSQFYINMRYPDRRVSYSLESACTEEKKNSVINAFAILKNETILEFYESSSEPEIVITCSQLPSEPGTQGHFVAGEGGPVKIINATRFAVILSGKVALYRDDKCKTPVVAIHELLHALGFDHSKNKTSIMFPVTDCNQKLDANIIRQINDIYKYESLPDLSIVELETNYSSRYLNFNMVLSNQGLAEAKNVSLAIFSNMGEIKSFSLDNLDIGQRKTFVVNNVAIPSKVNEIEFRLFSNDEELSTDNNIAEIKFDIKN